MNGPIAFYFINHDIEEHELRFQLRSLKAQGFSGLFMHSRAGNLIPYLSDLWFNRINFIISECIKLNLDPWLYDDDPFPSGAAGGMVTAKHPEYKASTLRADEYVVGGKRIDITVPAGNIIGVYAFANGVQNAEKDPWIDITSKCGTVRTDWGEMGKGTRDYYPPFKGVMKPHYRAQSFNPAIRIFHESDAAIEKVVVVTAAAFKGGVWGDYPDLMNRKATDLFIELTHKQYRKRIKKDYWKYIPGIFLDESKLIPTFPWNDVIPKRYEEKYGESFMSALPHIFSDITNRSPVIRNRYRTVTGELFNENFFRPINAWCKKNRIQFCGHISPEEDPFGQQVMTPNLITLLKSFGIPGVDSISSLIGSAKYPLINIGPKIGESVVSQTGKIDYLVEALGVSGEDLDGDRMKSIIDWCFSFGINRICIHGQFYSLDGPRKREAPPSIFYQQPYWKYFNAFSKYIAAVSDVLMRAKRDVFAGYLYPAAYFNTKTTAPEAHHPRDEKFYRHASAIGTDVIHLSSKRIGFDLIDDIEFEAAPFRNGTLTIGSARYEMIFIPDVPALSAEAIQRIKKLIGAGFPVFFMGTPPRTLDGKSIWGKTRIVRASPKIIQAISERRHGKGTDHLDIKTPETCTVREMRDGSMQYAFVYNQDEKSAVISCASKNNSISILDANSSEFTGAGIAATTVVPAHHGVLIKYERRTPSPFPL